MKTAGSLVSMLVVLLAPVSLFGQTAATARISGIVTDANGAVVAGATVKLVDKTTNAEKTATTNQDGSYVFASLEPATYQMTVSVQGFFTQVFSDVKADVAKAVNLDVSLRPGDINVSVTVTPEGTLLKSADSSVGNVLNEDRVKRLPNISRQVTQLLILQPAVAPDGSTSGARGDQNVFNLDGLDVSDNVGFRGSVGTVVPIPTESVEEFGVTVANPSATFGRAAGAQGTIITKRGTNAFHGSLYLYHENDNLNANSWNNNRLGLRRPELKDNRFGATVAGPFQRDKFFFFFHYEGQRFPGSREITRIVPTQSLRDGLLRFREATGAVQTIAPNAQVCGAMGSGPCDPRGLGSNLQVLNALRLLPLPNASGGDGLNTGAFTANLPFNLRTDYGALRLDYQINQNWSLNAKGSIFRSIQPFGVQANLTSRQFDDQTSQRPKTLLLALTGSPNPNLVNEFRFGHTFDNFIQSSAVIAAAAGFNLPIDLGGVAEPIDIARSQTISASTTEFLDNVTWTKGKHSFQFGGNFRRITTLHFRDDKLSVISTPIALIGAGSNVFVPPSQRLRPCNPAAMPPVTTNCIQGTDVGRYNQFYATLLGIVDNVTYLGTRDANLQPLPAGTGLTSDTSLRYFETYFADTWRVKPSLTVSYGLQYQLSTPPVEKQGQQALLVYRSNRELVDPIDYLRQKREAAEAGQIFNPDLAYLPVEEAGRSTTFDTDFTNFSPRISLAWQPSFKKGSLGRLFGDQHTVIRGGYGLIYDRLNTVSSVIFPVLGAGFGQTLTRGAPVNGSMQPFRAGVDGQLLTLLPTNSAATSPIVPNKVVGPSAGFGELVSLSLDPKLRTPRNHVVDVTIQRELPARMLLEVGYIGRFGRRLYQSVDLNSTPYFFRDRASGQRFSEAFDAVAGDLRAGRAVRTQPWFDNQFAAIGGTGGLIASGFAPFFANGDLTLLWNILLDGFRDLIGQPPYNNRQVGALIVKTNLGESNYHGLFVSLSKRASRGLTFDFNYTLSKSLDQQGFIQNQAPPFSNSFFPDLDYGPSTFDSRHVINANAVYDLPFGRGRRFSAGNWADNLIGDWYLAGIYTSSSGLPLTVVQSTQAFGAGLLGLQSGAIPRTRLNVGNNASSGVGSANVGTAGNPNIGGTGLSLFVNPQDVFNNFRPISLVQDGRQGRGTLRGLSRWNLDLSLGKAVRIGERRKFDITFSFFNVFNRVNFLDPGLNLTDPTNFGVISGAFNSRRVQVGARFEF